MAADQKWRVGAVLLTGGGLWFLFDLMGLPPGLIVLCGNSASRCPSSVESFRILYTVESLLSATMAASGILLQRSISRDLSMLDYVTVFLGFILAVFWVTGWADVLP